MTSTHITVGMLTYRRPEGLARALPEILRQVREVPGAELLVIDNDTEPSARAVVEAHAGAPVRYVHEPEPGIVAARNRALDEAPGHILVFIDDDEVPAPRWLQTLLDAHEQFGGAGVVGPVLADYEGPLDPWIAAGKFFERRRFPTGTQVPAAGTGNLLLDLDVVRRIGLRFDAMFHQSGGSDSAFTRELVRRGGPLFWCDEAPIVDMVPVERATRSWVVRRAYRVGNLEARVGVRQAPSRIAGAMVRGRFVLKGAARVGGGAVRTLVGTVVRDAAHHARGTRTVMRGAGMVAGAFGGIYLEYRR